MSVVFLFLFFERRGGGGGGSMRRRQNLEIVVFSVKKNFVRHFARFNFWRLSVAFMLKYYPILHVA